MKKILSKVGVVSCCVLFSAIHSQVKAQTRIITGQVNNQEKPLAGVTVTQEGTDHLTTTTASGAFSLQITGENPVLIFRHAEYSEQKIPTQGKSFFIISLTEKVKAIEEVVLNAGYYNVKARESTGSITKVAAKDIENQPVNNVLSAVQGRMAGVNITQNSGTPGGSFDVQIRGKNSLRNDGNYPLIIVDGIPLNANSNTITGLSTGALPRGISPLNAVNTADIESFTVLKDADATAIYGSRGANGVILITTKQGKNKNTSISFSATTSVSQVNRFLKLANTPEYLQLRRDAYLLDGIAAYPANAYDINGTWSPNKETDWYETLIGKTYINQQQHLNISGGSDQSRFFLSLYNSVQTTPYLSDFKYKKYGFNLSTVYTSKDKKLKIAPIIYYTKQENRLAEIDITNKIMLAPNSPDLYTGDQSINWENNTFQNPVAAFENKYSNTINTFSANVSTDYNFTEHLQFKLNTGYTHTQQQEFRTNPSSAYNPALGYTSSISTLYTGTVPRENWIVEPTLGWSRQWAKHRVNVLIGTTIENKNEQTLQITAKDFTSNELLYNLSNAKTQRITEDSEATYRYIAAYTRLNYGYADQYFVNITARRDGSSRFGPNKHFADFGAVGAAWIFSSMPMFKDSKVLSFGKLRGSFGITGSDQIGDYQFMNTYTISNLIYDGSVGLSPSRLFNPNFSWEKTQKTELALDAAFFKNKLNITLAAYRNRSSNQLVGLALPATTGFLSVQNNFPATVQNSGIEAELLINIIKNSALIWNWSANFSAPRSKLIAFDNISTTAYANTYVVGESMNLKKVYEYTGVDATTGVYTFKDINNDGKIDVADRTKTVDFGVSYFGGISSELRYKNASLSFLWQFVKQQQYDLHYYLGISGIAKNIPAYMLDYWTPSNTSATYQRPTTGTNSAALKAYGLYQNSDAVIVDASFIRLNNVQLNYNIPNEIGSSVELMLGLQAQNIFTITRYKGLDPQVLGLSMPTPKTWSLVAQIKF